MLTVRQDWAAVVGGAVAANLMDQLNTMRLRDEVGRLLTGAALDLLVSTWRRGDELPLILETVSESTWRIRNIYYCYLAANDDALLNSCIELSQSSEVATIIARHHEKLKRELLSAVLGDRTPSICDLDQFISWRITSATIDQNWPPGRAIRELLAAYNRRVTAAEYSRSILVQVPDEYPRPFAPGHT